MKADGSRLIPRKHTETLLLLSDFINVKLLEKRTPGTGYESSKTKVGF